MQRDQTFIEAERAERRAAPSRPASPRGIGERTRSTRG